MPLPYLAAELRVADPDLYLLSLFAPKERRESIWALFLFKHELARTRAAVSDVTLGLIRLQWWREEIGKIYEGGSGGQNPILSTLAPVIRAYDLPIEDFETLIYAHEFDLEDVAPANMDGLCHYVDFTTTPLFSLALKILGETETKENIQKIAIEYGLLSVVRNVPSMLMQRRCYLPQDMLDSKGLSLGKLFDSNHKDDILQILGAMFLLICLYQNVNSAFLNKILKSNRIWLSFLKKNEFDVFDARVQRAPPFLALRLLF